MERLTEEGSDALHRLQKLPPRLVFQDLFTVKALHSLAAASAVASKADDNNVLVSGVREVEHLTTAALSQATLSKHQLTKLCQVCLCCMKHAYDVTGLDFCALGPYLAGAVAQELHDGVVTPGSHERDTLT